MRAAALCLAFVALCFASPILAQETDIAAPSFSEKVLSDRLTALQNNDELSEEQKTQAKSFLDSAVSRLSDASRLRELLTQYQSELQNGPQRLVELQNRIREEREKLAKKPEPLGEMIGEAALYKLQQQLIQKESNLRALQAEGEGYTKSLQSLSNRQTTAPTELNQARDKLAEVSAGLSDLGETNLDGVNAARRTSLIARQYYRQMQVAALEAELASLPQRQELVTTRRTLANLRAELVARDVEALQDQTGERRVNEAEGIRLAAQNKVEELAEAHPAVQDMAQRNLVLAEQIKAIAAKESTLSKDTAGVRGQQAYVTNDVAAATELVSLGKLDRQAGATLRRLENQFITPREIKARLEDTRQDLARTTRQRIVAQENLRDLPLGRVDETLLREQLNVGSGLGVDPLSAEDISSLQNLVEDRRELLRQVAQGATAQISNLTELLGAQQSLLAETEELQSLLDENLLWVPSVPAIDFRWPIKIIRGTFEVFNPQNAAIILQVAAEQARNFWPLLLLAGLLIAGLFRLRTGLWANVVERSEKVGRVTVDSMWHTPNVALSGVLMALPFPLIFFMAAIIFLASDNPSPVVEGIGEGFASLSLFSLIMLTWRYWDRDKSLFGAHFKLPKAIREAVMTHMRWFLPVIGAGIFLSSVSDVFTGENVREGFSLFIFIAISLGLALFGFRVLWAKRDQWTQYLSVDNALVRHRGLISIIIIGAPLVVAFLAAAGYFDSAGALLSRLFISGFLFLVAYVIFGIVRRAIVVAQRQIKYRQAIERRDAALKAREEKAAAEERGEEMPAPAPVDTAEIDVTSITRQSSQLLSVIILTALALLMWMIWSDLLPALSFFDGFEIWQYNTGTLGEDGLAVMQSVTLWNLIQSLVFIGLTVVAARNLPGFLEVFVLSRVGVDAGTRYAVVTILGYLIVGAGVIIAFDRLGLQWSQLKWIATGLSVGIGFGLQKIIANFVSGLIILFERPVRIGDYVTIGDQAGTVSRIQIRATTLKDLENREILIPNEALISERVTNWTLSNSVTRIVVRVGIAYGSDTDRARELMLETVKANPKALDNPPPQVFFLGFGDSSLNFEIRVFLKNFDDRVPTMHAIHTEINKTLSSAGISIPFPQTDLNIVSQDIPLEIKTGTKPRKTKS